ncbi:hypothetical protein V9T40_000752 [Parthenolecanium corni]|uniref:PDZ domain-containing protein n=1 Tax=Parthenolecanium corni TaxID=536013 RepID=A0AAN9Y214_9HEMI
MALYPNLDQMNLIPEYASVPNNYGTKPLPPPAQASTNHLSLVSSSQSLYPALTEYMGFDLSDMTKKGPAIPAMNSGVVAIPAVPGQVTNGLRQLTLCKDAKGRVGLMVSAVNNGVFVCFILKNSPAALGGLRFGDQILRINDTVLAGYSTEKVHNLIRKLPVNNINFMIRDRPFERTITMQKDSVGRVGFEFNKGKITALVKDSSAARNGLVTDHHLLEVQGQNVIGMSDKEILKLINQAGSVITVTIIPSLLFEQMMKKMKADYVKAKMDHSAHV